MRGIVTIIVAFVAALGAQTARAQRSLESVWTGNESVDPDGDLEEWTRAGGTVAFVDLGKKQIVAGAGPYDGPEDLHAEIGLAHNAKALFAAFKVDDQAFVRRTPRVTIDDHVELWFATSKKGGEGVELFGVGVFPDPTRSPSTAEVLALSIAPEGVGAPIRGARAGIRGSETSYQIEVAIPWSAFPGGAAARRDLRVVAFAVDSDAADVKVHETIMGTGTRDLLGAPSEMPMLLQSDIGAGLREFNDSVGLPRDLVASYSAEANVCGDARKEEIDVVDNYIVVIGCTSGDGGFFYRMAPVSGGYGIDGLEVESIGGGRPSVALRYRDGKEGIEREWTEIYVIGEDGAFTTVFTALSAFRADGYTIENAIKIGGRTITVSATKIEGAVPSDPPEIEGNAMVADKKPLKYKYDGARFVRE